jgi:hypothetical protein
MFSSRRSFTDTRTTDARIGGHEALREFDVLLAQVGMVFEDLRDRRATARHLADVPYGEPTSWEHGLATEDVGTLDELALPLREVVEPRFDVVHGRVELDDDVGA